MKRWMLCAMVVAGGAALCQESSPKIAFDVVSIKPAQPQQMNQVRMQRSSDPGRARFNAFSLRDYIRIAYRVKDFQVQGPEWMDSDRFDVEGKFPEGATESQVPEMLQAMLADRFKLTLHRETKDHAIFALVPAKGGARLKPAENPVEGASAPGAGPGRGPMPRGGMVMTLDDEGAHLKGSSLTLASLAEMISRFTERPVVDMSKIDGQYDFDLVISPENLQRGRLPGGAMMMPPPGGGEGGRGTSEAPVSKGGTVQDAVERYGLRLEPRKAAMEILVVDHIEKAPTEN